MLNALGSIFYKKEFKTIIIIIKIISFNTHTIHKLEYIILHYGNENSILFISTHINEQINTIIAIYC